jgi:hypothetical protein
MALIDDSRLAPRASRLARSGFIYARPPAPLYFPTEELVPEGKRQLNLRTALYLVLQDAFAATDAIGSDQFVYWDPTDPKKCLAPDVFVKRGVPDTQFELWKVWERGAPDLAVEIVSKSDRPADDWETKLSRYHASGIAELVRFDPLDAVQPIRVWDCFEGDLVERAAGAPALRACVALDLWWVVVEHPVFGPTLRLARDREGRTLLPTPDEERVRLAQELAEERKARALAEHELLMEKHARMLAEDKLREGAEGRQREAEGRQSAERKLGLAMAELEQLRAKKAGKLRKKR